MPASKPVSFLRIISSSLLARHFRSSHGPSFPPDDTLLAQVFRSSRVLVSSLQSGAIFHEPDVYVASPNRNSKPLNLVVPICNSGQAQTCRRSAPRRSGTNTIAELTRL